MSQDASDSVEPQPALVDKDAALAPTESCTMNKLEEKASDVLTGEQALVQLEAELIEFEKQEVLGFDQVFYVSSRSVKKLRHPSDASTAEVPQKPEEQDPVFNHGFDDENGDYVILLHDHLAYRYEILERLGSGSFGQVLCCLDHATKTRVAIKIIRNRKKYTEQSMVEVQVLSKLHGTESVVMGECYVPSNKHIIRMKECFAFRSHVCLVFDVMGANLYEYLKLRSFKGLPLPTIQRITAQLVEALAFLRMQQVIHCDLKPENILIKSPLSNEIASKEQGSTSEIDSICLIDFGSSCLNRKGIFTYVQSRFYRSPEVILGHTYGMEIDMWSLGCILVELWTGHPIFAGEHETEQLACIMEYLGVPPLSFLLRCKRRRLFFREEEADDSAGVGCSYHPIPVVNSRGRKRIVASKSLDTLLGSASEHFREFIKRCLVWDPQHRLQPDEALLNPWILHKPGSAVTSNDLTSTVSMDTKKQIQSDPNG